MNKIGHAPSSTCIAKVERMGGGGGGEYSVCPKRVCSHCCGVIGMSPGSLTSGAFPCAEQVSSDNPVMY